MVDEQSSMRRISMLLSCRPLNGFLMMSPKILLCTPHSSKEPRMASWLWGHSRAFLSSPPIARMTESGTHGAFSVLRASRDVSNAPRLAALLIESSEGAARLKLQSQRAEIERLKE